MMQVQITVEGPTYAALQQQMVAEVQSFLAGAPAGTTATLAQIQPATKVGDRDAGWDPAKEETLKLPSYQMTYTWDVSDPNDPEPVQVVAP